MKWLIALMVLCPVAFAAFGCTANSQAELNEYFVVSCTDATANSTCYAVIKEKASGKQVDFQPETAFNEFKESFYATPNGGMAYGIRIRPDIYLENMEYTTTTYCGSGTTTDDFTVIGFASPMNLFGTAAKWVADNAYVFSVGILVLIVGLGVLYVGFR